MSSSIFFNKNVPQVSTTFDQWQKLFVRNFAQLATAYRINHVSLTNSAGLGNHTIVQLVEQEDDLKIQTNLGEFAIFTRNVADQTDQVFMQFQGNGQEFQYTAYQLYNISVRSQQTAFFTILPGNLVVYFGTLNGKNSGGTSIDLRPPVAKNIISVAFTPINITQPFVTYSETKNNEFITGLEIFVAPVKNGIKVINEMYYMVVANL